MKTIDAIKSRYCSIAQELGVSLEHVNIATTPQHDGSPHVEEENGSYSYVVTERGSEIVRRKTHNPEQVLYWLVADLTWTLAGQYELAHRVLEQDSRRIRFKKDLELLAKVNEEWARTKQLEYDQILRQYPYADSI